MLERMESERCERGPHQQAASAIVSSPLIANCQIQPRSVPKYQRKFSQTFTRRQSPEWRPAVRRYSVETGQLVSRQDYAVAHHHLGYDAQCKIDFTKSIIGTTRSLKDNSQYDSLGGTSDPIAEPYFARCVKSEIKGIENDDRARPFADDKPNVPDRWSSTTCSHETGAEGSEEHYYTLAPGREGNTTGASTQDHDLLSNSETRASSIDADDSTMTRSAGRRDSLTRLTTLKAMNRSTATICPVTSSCPSTTCCANASANTSVPPTRQTHKPQQQRQHGPQEAVTAMSPEDHLPGVPVASLADEALTMVSVGEKLRMQDQERKHVILSMALKHLIAPEQHPTRHCSSTLSSASSSNRESNLRSRSCSFGPATSASRVGATSDIPTSSSVVLERTDGHDIEVEEIVANLQICESNPETSSIFFVSSNLHQVFDQQQKLRLASLAGKNLAGSRQFIRARGICNSNNNNSRGLDEIKLQAYTQQQQQKYLCRLQSSRSSGANTPPRYQPQRQITASNPMRQLITGRLEAQESWRDQSSTSDCCDSLEICHEDRPKSSVAGSETSHEPIQTPPTRRSCSAFGKPSVNCDTLYTGMLSNTSNSNLEALIIESWLDDHPSFTHDYFMRKAPRQMIDDWLVANARVSNTNLSSQLDLRTPNNPISRPISQLSLSGHLKGSGAPSWRGSQSIGHEFGEQSDSSYYNSTHVSGNNNNHSSHSGYGCIRPTRSNSQSAAAMTGSRALAGSLTPIRKISATDFETRSGTGFLRPMLSKTPDGRLTFLPQTNLAGSTSSISSATTKMGCLPERTAPAIACHVPKKADHDRSNSRVVADRLASGRYNQQVTDGHQCGQSDAPSGAHEPVRRADDRAGRTGTLNEDNRADFDTNQHPAHDEGEVRMIFELVKNIYDDLDIRTLFHKILKNIAVLINADRSSLFLVCGGPNDPNRRLVSQLFNIDQDSQEVSDSDGEDSITIPWGVGLVGYVAESGEAVNIVNCYEDPRFTDAIDQRTGYVTRHMLCAPILDKHNEIVGVAQVINKRDGNPFSKNDEVKFKRYLQFCGIGLRNAQSYEQCQLENRRNQVLLDLARMVFEEQSTIEQVVHRIMLHTQSLLDCERCQVLLIDNGNDELDGLLQMSSARQTATTHCSSTTQEDQPTCMKRTEWRPQCSKQRRSCEPDAADIAANGGAGADADRVTIENDCELASAASSENNDLAYQHLDLPNRPARLFSLVFDLECDGKESPIVYDTRSADEQSAGSGCDNQADRKNRAFPVNIGITGYVATTGETLNIEDAHKHERFDASVDENTDFRHKSILCMPIRNGQRQIIGVIQLINKKNGQPFNKNDEDLFEAFAIFCGLGIHNTLMYERVLKVMAKQRVTFEVLSYHATAPLEEAKKLCQEQVPSCFALNLASLKFNDFSLDEQYMLKSCLRFFLDLDLMRRFQIDHLVLCNWILSVQKNYRKVTYHPVVGGNGLKASPVRYHNWRHAFNVSQMMFAILVNTQICHSLGELETLALLIACLCHDLDHRGTNNSFQIKSASPLAELYSTSTMEHHHFDQCVMILNSQGNQILSNLSPEEYSRVIMLLEEAILATDLANYFQKRDNFFQLVNSGRFDWRTDSNHRSILRCMLMTACDVAAITKPWPVQKVVADLVMSEFYQQGDIEKNELKIEPIDMMNRDKMSELPAMQISFIDTICAPIYTAFAKLFPQELETLLDGCLTNRSLWREVAESQVVPEVPLISLLN